MAILGLQGVRGGVGTTSITAALAWSLQLLGESVLVIDACPDNMLRLSFNDDIARESGWARATLDGQDWRDAALRYTAQIDILPFGKLRAGEQQHIAALGETLAIVTTLAQTLEREGRYQWILIDLPYGFYPWMPALVEACHYTLTVVKPDANCHIRLHQQVFPQNTHILINETCALTASYRKTSTRCGYKRSVICYLSWFIATKRWLRAWRASSRWVSIVTTRLLPKR